MAQKRDDMAIQNESTECSESDITTSSDDEVQTITPGARQNIASPRRVDILPHPERLPMRRVNTDILKSKVVEHEKRIQVLNTENWEIVKQNKDIVKNYTNLQNAIVSLNMRVDVMEKEKLNMGKEIDRLKNDLRDKTNEIEDMQKEMQQQNEQVVELKGSNEDLRARMMETEKQLEGCKQTEVEVNDLKTEISRLKTETSNVETIVKNQEQQRQQLQKQYQQQQLRQQHQHKQQTPKRSLSSSTPSPGAAANFLPVEESSNPLLTLQELQEIQNDSKFNVVNPFFPGSTQIGKAAIVREYRDVETDCLHINTQTGVYTTPVPGKYKFGGLMIQADRGKMSLYLCGDTQRRQELLVTTDSQGDVCDQDLYWECEEGEHVWLEVVRLEGKAKVLSCGFYGHLIKWYGRKSRGVRN